MRQVGDAPQRLRGARSLAATRHPGRPALRHALMLLDFFQSYASREHTARRHRPAAKGRSSITGGGRRKTGGHTCAAQFDPMHAPPMLAKPMRSLAFQGAVFRIRFRADALGNALGSSLAEAASSLSQAQPSASASGSSASGGWDREPADYSLASAAGRVRFGTGSVEAQPTPEQVQAAFRTSEREYRDLTEDSAAGAGYRARAGDSISRIVGSSSPQAIGNFMLANNLTSDRIEVGRNYFVPDDLRAYGDSTAVGQFALNQGNERIAAARAASLIAADGMRIGPTVERAQAMGIYSGDGTMTLAAGGAYPEMRAPAFSARQTAVDWVSSVVGTSRAGNVITGAVDAWLATPELLSKLPDAVGAIPSGVVRLANGTVSAATQLWNDPLGTVTDAMASGVDGLRSGFNRTVNGDGRAMGSALFALGTAGVPLGRAEGVIGTASELDMFRRVANQGAFADLPVLMDLKTARSYAQEAGVGLDGVKVRIIRHESLLGSGFFGYTHPNGKSIDLYPDAFSSSEELVRTLGHERTHVYQARTFGAPQGAVDLRLNESAAFGLEDSFVKYWRTNGGR
jgi:hypothetical protein